MTQQELFRAPHENSRPKGKDPTSTMVKQSIREDYRETVLENETVPIIERPFELPLGVLQVEQEFAKYGFIKNIYVAWSGRIDRVAESNMRNRNKTRLNRSVLMEGKVTVARARLVDS